MRTTTPSPLRAAQPAPLVAPGPPRTTPPVGPNPALTIAALALRTGDHIARTA